MKTIRLTLFFSLLLAMSVVGEPKPVFSPVVHRFIVERVLKDQSPNFVETQKWLLDQKQEQLSQKDRDSMWEVLSGLIYNQDQKTARKLVENISNPKKRKEIYRHYDELDKINSGT